MTDAFFMLLSLADFAPGAMNFVLGARTVICRGRWGTVHAGNDDQDRNCPSDPWVHKVRR
jgi:hypothetical protein